MIAKVFQLLLLSLACTHIPFQGNNLKQRLVKIHEMCTMVDETCTRGIKSKRKLLAITFHLTVYLYSRFENKREPNGCLLQHRQYCTLETHEPLEQSNYCAQPSTHYFISLWRLWTLSCTSGLAFHQL